MESSFETSGSPIFGVFTILLGLVFLALHIFVLVDMLKHSDAAWQSSGQNKALWVVLWVVGFCACLWVPVDAIYWFAIRPKLQAAEGSASSGYPT